MEVDGKTVGKIDRGILVLLGVKTGDTPKDAEYLAGKVAKLRIFPDESGRMNRSAEEIGGAILVVSQFTLYGDCRKGRRPGFDDAAPPDLARELYEYFNACLRSNNLVVATGQFQAEMRVHLVNDGPVTFILDSK